MNRYIEYALEFEEVYKALYYSRDIEKDIDDLCFLRGYFGGNMKNTLIEMGVFHIDQYDFLHPLASEEKLKKFGLLGKKGNFILEGGYIVPIRDIEGYLVALVGWFPGRSSANKYITTPTKYFKKAFSLFNIDNAVEISDYKYVFVVEGIFDAIAMRSIGLPCVSIQGAEMSDVKRIILKQFRKQVGVPDNDAIGKSEIVSWALEGNVTYIEIKGSVQLGDTVKKVKDCDDIIKYFDNMNEVFMSVVSSKLMIEVLEV